MSDSVLVVDDDPTFIALMTRILDDLGVAAVTTAVNAAQALALAHETKPGAVLVDVGLPDRSGIELAYELADLPWAPRVILTSSNSEAYAAIERQAGRRVPQFIAKNELEADTLDRVLVHA